LDYRAKMVKLKFLLILKTGIFLLSLLVLQGVNGDKVFAQPLPALEYCEPGTLINCDEYPPFIMALIVVEQVVVQNWAPIILERGLVIRGKNIDAKHRLVIIIV
jgi:hypothetical protein